MKTQDKKDLKRIIQESIMEFWDKALEPVLKKLYKKVDRLDKKVIRLDKKIGRIEEDTKDIKETVTRMEDRVDDIAADAISHEKRLGKIESKIHLSA